MTGSDADGSEGPSTLRPRLLTAPPLDLAVAQANLKQPAEKVKDALRPSRR